MGKLQSVHDLAIFQPQQQRPSSSENNNINNFEENNKNGKNQIVMPTTSHTKPLIVNRMTESFNGIERADLYINSENDKILMFANGALEIP